MIKLLSQFNGHEGRINCFISHDGFLYSGGDDNVIKKWKWDACIQTFIGHKNPIIKIIVHNGYLYSCSYNELLKWNVNGKFIKLESGQFSYFKNHYTDIISYNGYIYSNSEICNYILKWKDDAPIKNIKFNSRWWGGFCYLRTHDNHLYLGSKRDGIIYKLDNNDDIIQHIDLGYGYLDNFISHDNHLYTIKFDENGVKKLDIHGLVLKNYEKKSYPYFINFVSCEDCLYCYTMCDIFIWKNDTCIQNILNIMTGLNVGVNHNGYFYIGNYKGKIQQYGEFWPHNRDQLPKTQKEKIKNWQTVKQIILIQKDIHFLFERELLTL